MAPSSVQLKWWSEADLVSDCPLNLPDPVKALKFWTKTTAHSENHEIKHGPDLGQVQLLLSLLAYRSFSSRPSLDHPLALAYIVCYYFYDYHLPHPH